MNQSVFKPQHHIPRYSRVLLQALKTPILIYFALAGNFLTFSSAYIFYALESEVNPNVNSYWDGAWWALCTVSTVGYGDIFPITTVGRILGAFLIVVGVAFFLGFMAIMVTLISTADKNP